MASNRTPLANAYRKLHHSQTIVKTEPLSGSDDDMPKSPIKTDHRRTRPSSAAEKARKPTTAARPLPKKPAATTSRPKRNAAVKATTKIGKAAKKQASSYSSTSESESDPDEKQPPAARQARSESPTEVPPPPPPPITNRSQAVKIERQSRAVAVAQDEEEMMPAAPPIKKPAAANRLPPTTITYTKLNDEKRAAARPAARSVVGGGGSGVSSSNVGKATMDKVGELPRVVEKLKKKQAEQRRQLVRGGEQVAQILTSKGEVEEVCIGAVKWLEKLSDESLSALDAIHEAIPEFGTMRAKMIKNVEKAETDNKAILAKMSKEMIDGFTVAVEQVKANSLEAKRSNMAIIELAINKGELLQAASDFSAKQVGKINELVMGTCRDIMGQAMQSQRRAIDMLDRRTEVSQSVVGRRVTGGGARREAVNGGGLSRARSTVGVAYRRSEQPPRRRRRSDIEEYYDDEEEQDLVDLPLGVFKRRHH